MGKFDALPTLAPRRRDPDTITAQGGDGFGRSMKQELILLGVANFVSEDTFFEAAADRDDRFTQLVTELTKSDPEWVASFVAWLRGSANMRSASVVAAATYVRAGGPNGRRVVASALQRPDEPGEMLAFWRATYGRQIPAAVKRGVADATQRLYTERNLLRYDGSGKNWRFGDVLRVVHPKPLTPNQAALFAFATARRDGKDTLPMIETLPVLAADRALMALPEGERRAAMAQAIEAGWSWERLAGWLPGGMDAAAWESVIPNMGVMALIRNLRNFDQAGISDAPAGRVIAKLSSAEDVRRSKVFPLRMLSAWKNVDSVRWAQALETALGHSLANVPEIRGRSLVLIDISGSMGDWATTSHKGTGKSPLRSEVAGLFGAAVAQRSDAADVYAFDDRVEQVPTPTASTSILRWVEQYTAPRGGTDTIGAILKTFKPGVHDRIVIVTDEQTGPSVYQGRSGDYSFASWRYYNRSWDDVKDIRVPVVTFNLAGYRVGHTPVEGNWLTLGGLTDASFGLVANPGLNERPWDLAS